MVWLKDVKYDDGGWTEGDDNDKDTHKDEDKYKDKDKDKDNDKYKMTKTQHVPYFWKL